METFKHHMHEVKVKWMEMSTEEKVAAINEMAKLDSDAAVKMKTIGRRCVSRGRYTKKWLKEYFEFVDVWLDEHAAAGAVPPELAVWQKIGIMTYARKIAQ